MTAVRIEIAVADIDTEMETYDQISVYRSATEGGTYAEITTATLRVDLIANQSEYEYVDRTAPNSIYWFKTTYYNSVTLAESSQSTAFQGIYAGLYVTLDDIRDEGFDVDTVSDDRAIFLSKGWQDWIEHKTGQWFYPRELTMYFDGSDARSLWLNIPIITLTSLYMNDDFNNVVDESVYAVYNRYYPEDDRKNPRIKVKTSLASDIFTGSYNTNKFLTGDQNQKLIGTFGYVEEDMSVPFAIKRAIMVLISISVENLSDGDIDVMAVGRKIEEVTDRHRVKFADLWDRLGVWNPTGITEVDQALAMYRKVAYVGMARSLFV